MLEYQIFVQQEGEWFVAHNMEFGIASQGKTLDEALKNIKEATELYLEDIDQTELNDYNKRSLSRQYFLTSIRVAHG